MCNMLCCLVLDFIFFFVLLKKNKAEILFLIFSLEKNIELAAEDLRLTAREIGKIIGDVGVENILDSIFSRFCIGK